MVRFTRQSRIHTPSRETVIQATARRRNVKSVPSKFVLFIVRRHRERTRVLSAAPTKIAYNSKHQRSRIEPKTKTDSRERISVSNRVWKETSVRDCSAHRKITIDYFAETNFETNRPEKHNGSVPQLFRLPPQVGTLPTSTQKSTLLRLRQMRWEWCASANMQCEVVQLKCTSAATCRWRYHGKRRVY